MENKNKIENLQKTEKSVDYCELDFTTIDASIRSIQNFTIDTSIQSIQNFDYMVRIIDILKTNYDDLPDFCRKFLEVLQQHVEKNCVHNWIDDSIDVCYGEHSINIQYCTKCYSTKDQLLQN